MGYIKTSYSKLKRMFGNATIHNGKISWTITIKDKEYIIYDYMPFESSQFLHQWKVDSKYTDLSELEDYINSQ